MNGMVFKEMIMIINGELYLIVKVDENLVVIYY